MLEIIISRDIVDNVLKETISNFWRNFTAKTRANFTFGNVGTIQLKGEAVRTVFCGNFLDEFDEINKENSERPKLQRHHTHIGKADL